MPEPVCFAPIQLVFTPTQANQLLARLTETGLTDPVYLTLRDANPLAALHLALSEHAGPTLRVGYTDTTLTLTIPTLTAPVLMLLDQIGAWLPDGLHALYPHPNPALYTVVACQHAQLMVGTIERATLSASTAPYQHA